MTTRNFHRVELVYEHLIEKHHTKIDHVELSVLASLSKGFTAGQILYAINKVLHSKRKDQYATTSLTAKDFIVHLGLQSPVFIDEEDKIKVRQGFSPLVTPRTARLDLVRQNTSWYEASGRSHSISSENRAEVREEDQLDFTDCFATRRNSSGVLFSVR